MRKKRCFPISYRSIYNLKVKDDLVQSGNKTSQVDVEYRLFEKIYYLDKHISYDEFTTQQ